MTLNVSIYLRIISLIYADDTVLFAKSTEKLQALSNDFVSCCDERKL